MREASRFAQGLGAGAGLILMLATILLLPRGRRSLRAVLRRMDDASRTGRSPWTGEPPPNYLDLCRAAGL
ncbi:MAG: hypothetical protein ABI682_14325 [Acidobacteriota bacterium]